MPGIPLSKGMLDITELLLEPNNNPMEPNQTGPTTIAVFDDTCGNLIQIVQA